MIVDTKTDLFQAAPNSSGPVTLEDVRGALGETDPSTTNASKLRAVLGRGSFATIQKHLDFIRAELAAPALEAAGKAPDVPKDVLQALWSVAWTAASAAASGALAAAQQHAQVLAAALAVAQSDAAAAQQSADDMTDALAVQQRVLIAQSDESLSVLEAVRESGAQQQRVIDELRAELAQQVQQQEQQQQQQEQAQALATARAQAVEATLRGELDRHVSQLADLRAALSSKQSEA